MRDDESGATVLGAAPPRVLHSDPHDFAGLYIRHRMALTLHARHYLDDPRDADEVVQEAFLRLFLALPELETELQALAYCRRTITNLCIDRYRAQSRRPRVVDIATVPLEELAGDEPADPVVRAEDAAVVRTALSLLSPLHRAALVKREIEEKPLPVIAEELQVPEDSVKHLLFRARGALRRVLAGTSLAPGTDIDRGLGLGATVRAGSGGLAAFVLLIALGVGSGPDLESVPVVGVDLPDIIGVTVLAKGVGHVVTDAVEAVSPGGGSSAARDSTPTSGSRATRGADVDGAPDAVALSGSRRSPASSALPPSAPPPTEAPAVAAGPAQVPGPPRTLAPAVAVAPPSPEPAPDAPAPVVAGGAPSTSVAPDLAGEQPSPEPAPEPSPVVRTPPVLTSPPTAEPSAGPAPEDSAASEDSDPAVPTAVDSVAEVREPQTGRLVEAAPPALVPTEP